MKKIRLGVNIDHVATLRNARGENFPNLLEISAILKKSNIDLITVHLREDRRHINDNDLRDLKNRNDLPLNLEMAATQEMKNICLNLRPYACCIVPEKREELTTEGGLDVKQQKVYLAELISDINNAGIKSSLFIDPDEEQIRAAKDTGANAVEIHTGSFSRAFNKKNHNFEIQRIKLAAEICQDIDIDCHAGHGLNFDNVCEVASISNIIELNVGHFLISNSIYDGLSYTIQKFMKIIKHPSI